MPSVLRPPAAVSGTLRSVTAPVGSGQPGGTRLSNLDLTGRLVKKHCIVSYHGIRFQVNKVNRGYCYGRLVSINGRVNPFKDPSERLLCESVQVVQ